MEKFSKPKDIFFSNFNKICRTCIKTITEPLHQIFDSEVVILNESIRTCELLIAVSTLKIHPDDDLPKAICIQCLDSLTKAYNFQKMCILSDLCMRSAIIPKELQISLQNAPLTDNNKQTDNSNIFDPFIQTLMAPSENPILESDILPSEDLNTIKILVLPAESDLIQSGSNMIIPRKVNNSMNVFPPVSTTIANVDPMGSNIVTPNEIKSNINIFPTETRLLDHVDPSDETIPELRMQCAIISTEPKFDFGNVSLSEVPPWKRGPKFQSIKSTIKEQRIQSVKAPRKNKRSINIFTNELLTNHIKHLNLANDTETYVHSKMEVNKFKEASAASAPIQVLNVANEAKRSEQSSIIQSQSGNLLANAPSLKVEIGKSSGMTFSQTAPTDEKIIVRNNLLTDVDSTDCDINKTNRATTIQIKETMDHDENDDKSNIKLLADSHSTEHNIYQSDVSNVHNIESISAKNDDNDDGDVEVANNKSEDCVDGEDLIHRNILDSKEEPVAITSFESEESNTESLDQNSTEENCDNDMENPVPVVQEIEIPNARTNKNAYFTCETCGKTFDREHRLHRHMNFHRTEGRPFECEYCRRRFAQEAHLQRHFIIHEKRFLDMIEAKPNADGYQCTECPRKFLKKESLASHMRIHRKEIDASKRFKCEICPKVFESLYRLTRHKQLHEGNRKYKCEICGKTFGLSSHLVDHLNMHTGIKPHACDYCQKSFQQACALRDHLRIHTGEQPFLCAECGKTFNNASNLRQHQLRHSGIKRYQCPECPSRFTCKSGLFSHKSTHGNQKPYACDTCGSKFTKSFSLKKHERIHTGERPYKCDYCEMRFNSSDHMKRHMRTHTGEKPYKCKYCERKFAQSNDMIKHLRSHVGENVYKCDQCNSSFRLNTELKKHISEHYQAQVKDKTKKK